MSGIEPGTVTSGARGTTRERQDGSIGYPPHFALKTTPDKDMVGGLGQAVKRVGVWGESLQRVGVVGNSGDELSAASLPGSAQDPTPIGVYGTVSQNDGISIYGRTAAGSDAPGVVGQARSKGVVGLVKDGGDFDPASLPTTTIGVYGSAERENSIGVMGKVTTAYSDGVKGEAAQGYGVSGKSTSTDLQIAGVRAEGAGNTGAAALEVRNGAIRVTGDTKPAGSIDVSLLGFPGLFGTAQLSCPECSASVDLGWVFNGTLVHPLIKPDSIILLTVDFGGSPPDDFAMFAAAHSKSNGSVQIRVASNLCDLNDDDSCDFFDIDPLLQVQPRVNYLIINRD